MYRLRAIWLTLGLAALLTACGPSSNNVTVAMKDMRFRQEEVQVKAGQPVTLRVINQDGYAHAFDIDAFDLHRPLAANETVELIFTPQQAGRYRFYCGAPGHEAAGMVGVLIVEP
jgi:uncharacterized cupredoxin-like copper-binding protein